MGSSTSNPTWRNHYLPQAYLSHFCNASGEVLRTFLSPKGQLYQKRFAPKATGYEEHLYSFRCELRGSPVRDPDHIEREVFGPIDREGIKAVRKIIEFAPSHLSSDELDHLALFLNSFLERNPQKLRERDETAKKMAMDRLEALRVKLGPPPGDRLDVLDLVNGPAMARNALMRFMVEEIRDTKVIDYLKGFTFMKVHINDNPVVRFITGDSPVLVNSGKEGPINWFTFALDPCNLLIGHGLKEPLTDTELLIHLGIAHNLELLRQCEYIFSRDPLEDTGIINTKRAGEMFLPEMPWPQRRERRGAEG